MKKLLVLMLASAFVTLSAHADNSKIGMNKSENLDCTKVKLALEKHLKEKASVEGAVKKDDEKKDSGSAE